MQEYRPPHTDVNPLEPASQPIKDNLAATPPGATELSQEAQKSGAIPTAQPDKDPLSARPPTPVEGQAPATPIRTEAEQNEADLAEAQKLAAEMQAVRDEAGGKGQEANLSPEQIHRWIQLSDQLMRNPVVRQYPQESFNLLDMVTQVASRAVAREPDLRIIADLFTATANLAEGVGGNIEFNNHQQEIIQVLYKEIMKKDYPGGLNPDDALKQIYEKMNPGETAVAMSRQELLKAIGTRLPAYQDEMKKQVDVPITTAEPEQKEKPATPPAASEPPPAAAKPGPT